LEGVEAGGRVNSTPGAAPLGVEPTCAADVVASDSKTSAASPNSPRNRIPFLKTVL
jgi:hypothetical protein